MENKEFLTLKISLNTHVFVCPLHRIWRIWKEISLRKLPSPNDFLLGFFYWEKRVVPILNPSFFYPFIFNHGSDFSFAYYLGLGLDDRSSSQTRAAIPISNIYGIFKAIPSEEGRDKKYICLFDGKEEEKIPVLDILDRLTLEEKKILEELPYWGERV